MRNVFRNLVSVSTFVMFMGVGFAQSDWYHNRDERFHGERWRAHMFSEIREDLNHVQANAFSGRDEYRIMQTKHELDELQGDLTAHRYEQPKLDDVISSLQRVTADNHLDSRDRDVLNDDLQKLRDYREHHENWIH
ncbi:MAG TPA: hypothetical protein VKU01_09670 [Bryobacteraceae bacterium]|nr:hypothetical protein [Bryobacteraceae bacterium]